MNAGTLGRPIAPSVEAPALDAGPFPSDITENGRRVLTRPERSILNAILCQRP